MMCQHLINLVFITIIIIFIIIITNVIIIIVVPLFNVLGIVTIWFNLTYTEH